jgi:hypothetical protein
VCHCDPQPQDKGISAKYWKKVMNSSAYFDGLWISRHEDIVQRLPVIFRATKAGDEGPYAGRAIAILPTLPGDPLHELTCYGSGRHFTGTRQWYLHCTQRCPVEKYMPLLAELCSIYPDADLCVEPRISLDHDFERFKAATRLRRKMEARFDQACAAVREILESHDVGDAE